MKKSFIIVIFLIATGLPLYSAGSLSATGELYFENLVVGKIFHANEEGKNLFRLTNNTDQDIVLRIDPIVADKGLLRKGFEKLPDMHWVKTDVSTLKLSPGQVGSVDVIISIPYKKKFMGKKYQFHIWSRIIPSNKGSIKVSAGTESVFLVTTAK